MVGDCPCKHCPLSGLIRTEHSTGSFFFIPAGAEPWDSRPPGEGLGESLAMPEMRSSKTTISRAWTLLEKQQHVRSERYGPSPWAAFAIRRRRRPEVLAIAWQAQEVGELGERPDPSSGGGTTRGRPT
jgi:hypothetical protein